MELVVIQGGGRGGRHSLTAPRIVLGRLDPHESPAFGNLLFPEPTVSRVHATLDWDESAHRYLLTHKSATNPTLVNKSRISQPRHVHPGDKIQMGNLILEIRVGIGQHAELELSTVDFTALTKRAADQVYRPETVMPEAPALPAAGVHPPQENPAPIPAPIPPPSRRNLPQPVFHEPYAPVLKETVTPVAEPFFEFPEADEQVKPVSQAPRRILLSTLPRQDEPVPGLHLAPEIPEVELADEWVVIEDSVEPNISEPTMPEVELPVGEAEVVESRGEEESAEAPAEEIILEEPAAAEEATEGLAEEMSTEAPPAEEEATYGLTEEVATEEPPAEEGATQGLPQEMSTEEPPAGEEATHGLTEEMATEEPPAEEGATQGLTEEMSTEEPPAEEGATQGLAQEMSTEEPPAAEESPEPEFDGKAAEGLAKAVVAQELAAESAIREAGKPKPVRRDVRKVGRNEKCPCGSGKKYKKCCGAKK